MIELIERKNSTGMSTVMRRFSMTRAARLLSKSDRWVERRAAAARTAHPHALRRLKR